MVHKTSYWLADLLQLDTRCKFMLLLLKFFLILAEHNYWRSALSSLRISFAFFHQYWNVEGEGRFMGPGTRLVITSGPGSISRQLIYANTAFHPGMCPKDRVANYFRTMAVVN
ncbi:hypothetical protein CDAR_289651 [Caerostris darwini]|uniref:Uncharacterized protein n=1 Tax=Caerostris darwini TaxID=1538125 RepID=A0AAV4WXD2_9ARAC|nr:hypothetical protein CDAR_289651 [Caerostris darwini]